jgi:hypothetical protein
MNCELLQRRLLNLERPDRPPAEVLAHLAACPSCREWQRRLVRLEQRVALLPVPASTGKAEFLVRLRAGAWFAPVRQPNGAAIRGQRRDFALRKLALATSLAAGLVLFAVFWWALQWSPSEQKLPDDLLAQLVQHDMALARADNQTNRLKELAATAEDVHAQAGLLCRMKCADDLAELASWYRQVVEKLPQQAQGVATGDSESIVQRLSQAENESRKLVAGAPPDCAAPLRDMASAAREAAGRLRSAEVRAGQPSRARAALPAAPPVLCAGAPVLTASLVPAAGPGPLFATAAPGGSTDSAAELAQRFRKNINLLRTLVKEAVLLADLPGDQCALKRAKCCNAIVEKFAEEINGAAVEQQGARVADLGKFLKSVLQDGVATNLSAARQQLPQGKVSMNDLKDVESATESYLGTLPDGLRGMQDPREVQYARSALAAIQEGREQVHKVLQGTP